VDKMPHKNGWVESELLRIAEGSAPVSDRHFQILVAEALLMLLNRSLDVSHAAK
jgi:hypothetical protein